MFLTADFHRIEDLDFSCDKIPPYLHRTTWRDLKTLNCESCFFLCVCAYVDKVHACSDCYC